MSQTSNRKAISQSEARDTKNQRERWTIFPLHRAGTYYQTQPWFQIWTTGLKLKRER